MNDVEFIENKVIDLVKRVLPDRMKMQNISLYSRLKDDLMVDSLKLVELLVAFEREFRLNISRQKNIQFTMIRDLVTFVTQMQEEKSDEKK